MENTNQNGTPILSIAWSRYAQYDSASSKQARAHSRLRRWVAILGVLATLFAIITQIYPQNEAIGSLIFKILLIVSPLLASVLAAFTSKFYNGGNWLVMRAGAEEILKEIYNYRTVLQQESTRRVWLENRLQEIQRQVYRGMGGEMALEPYEGKLPPYYFKDDPYSDPGFQDLIGDEYFTYRVQQQLGWHTYKINQFQAERTKLQVFILLAGAASAGLAAIGGGLSLWVALTASMTTALIGWQELRNLDATVRNYSKVILELTLTSDHWSNLEHEERTQNEFYQMVQSTENILWGQNVEYIKSMQEAITTSKGNEEDLIENVLKQTVEQDKKFKQSIADAAVQGTLSAQTQSDTSLTDTYKKTFGSLAEEASSELVQQELAAMSEAAKTVAQNIVTQASQFQSAIDNIAEEFKDVTFDRYTSSAVLNQVMSKYPKPGEVKG